MHPELQDNESSAADSGNPKFGRLLIVLAGVVLLVVAITLASEAYYS